MLSGDFFNISNLQSTGSDVKADLVINASHKIFEGHFPGQPVVPGVCMMQMVKEILEASVEKKTDLVKAHEMKFLAILDPTKNNLIHSALNYREGADGTIAVTATLFKDELVHFKFKGQFAFQQQ
jgi:3-hydroxyacyl-[acyl-carrier-protein] dehydratase